MNLGSVNYQIKSGMSWVEHQNLGVSKLDLLSGSVYAFGFFACFVIFLSFCQSFILFAVRFVFIVGLSVFMANLTNDPLKWVKRE